MQLPHQATSGSCPELPEWGPAMQAWVADHRSRWPLKAGHIAEMFAGDEDVEALVRWARDGVPIVHPGQVPPAFSGCNGTVAPQLAAYAAAAAQQELQEGHVAVPPAGVHSPWVHSTHAVPKGPKDAPTGARRIHDFARPSGGAVNDCVRYLPRAFTTARQFADQLQPG